MYNYHSSEYGNAFHAFWSASSSVARAIVKNVIINQRGGAQGIMKRRRNTSHRSPRSLHSLPAPARTFLLTASPPISLCALKKAKKEKPVEEAASWLVNSEVYSTPKRKRIASRIASVTEKSIFYLLILQLMWYILLLLITIIFTKEAPVTLRCFQGEPRKLIKRFGSVFLINTKRSKMLIPGQEKMTQVQSSPANMHVCEWLKRFKGPRFITLTLTVGGGGGWFRNQTNY